MAWINRTEIAPGIYLDLSKVGVSTTIGVRGSSLTRNGQYVNTGIPGTGFYERTKLVHTHQAHAPLSNSSADPKTAHANTLVVAIAMAIGVFCISLAFSFLEGCIVWAVFVVLLIFVAVISGMAGDKSKEVDPSLWIYKAKATLPKLQGETKEVLKNFIDCYELARQIEYETKVVNALEDKMRGASNTKLEQLLWEHQSKLEELNRQLADVQIDVDAPLTDEEKEAYGKVCDAFEQVMHSAYTWFVAPSNYGSPTEPHAQTTGKRRQASAYVGVFDYLKSDFDVPVLDTGDTQYYIYPKFVIKASNVCEFEVYPLTPSAITASIVKYAEAEVKPLDAHSTEEAWLYANGDGSPDKRHTNNKLVPVYQYGCINFDLGSTQSRFMFSNGEASERFAEALALYVGKPNASSSSSEEEGMALEKANGSFYPAMEKAATNLYLHVKSMNGMEDVIEAMNKQHCLAVADNLPFTVNHRLALAAFADAWKCYKCLGHQIDYSKPEIIALSIFCAELGSEDALSVVSSEQLMRSQGIAATKGFIKVMEDSFDTNFPDDKFFVIEILRANGIDEDVINKYAVLLYRFASILAKADGNVDEKETAWLANMVKFTESPNKGTERAANNDELLSKVAEYVVSSQRCSASAIQREFQIGYRRAEKLLDQLAEWGIVGQASDSHPRAILVNDKETLHKWLGNRLPKAQAGGKGRETAHAAKDAPALQQLDKLIGLESVKEEVNKLTNFIKVQNLRKQKGMNAITLSYHCVFTGNPGTGKTTVARIVAQIYRELGILKKGQLVETDRSGLVAEYVGQTAVKTNKIIDSALDGVLFIDEAYSLVQGGGNDYGKEAIATLLKRMEDDRDRLIVILAGYDNEMKLFIDSNPGLQSRFNRYIHFSDYNAEELMAIFKLNLKKFDYELTNDAEQKISHLFSYAVSHKDQNFGNGRYARNVLEKTLENQATRLASVSEITEQMLRTIEEHDIPT